jgi:hypothetical protein
VERRYDTATPASSKLPRPNDVGIPLMGYKRCASAHGEVTVCVGVQPREEARQIEYIAFDAHKHYTLASVVTADGQRNGMLPTVWIPPGDLRDQRDLPRTRMAFVR